MSLPFPLPLSADQPAVGPVGVIEPIVVLSAHCDGASAIHVLPGGRGHINLWAHQLGTDGDMERVLVSRLTMSRDVMREVALAMLSECQLDEERMNAMRKKMT